MADLREPLTGKTLVDCLVVRWAVMSVGLKVFAPAVQTGAH